MTCASQSSFSNETLLYPLCNDKNFETYVLVWLDQSINSKENLNAQKRFRLSINYLQTFDELDECEKYIRSVPSDDRIVLIVNGHFGEKFIPQIHHLRQIFSIYIFCSDKSFHQQWSQQYIKVKSVHDQLNELINQIQSDYSKRTKINQPDEPLSISIFNSKTKCEQSTTGLDGRFVQSQLLISCLLKMETTSVDKDQFILQCQEIYKGNPKELDNVHEFKEHYTSEDAFWWYTTETFLYQLLNKAFRIQNIDLLFLIRFFIHDIEEQLHQHRYSSPIRVYRGQLMSLDEMNILKDSINKLISINSFLSTSRNPHVALMYLDVTINDNTLEKVLFEIDVDPNQPGIKPFADISKISRFPEEEEILMMVGSIFRLKNIYLDQQNIWHIEMTLCSDNDCDLQAVFHHMKNQYGATNAALLLFANVLIDMANFDDAEKYLCRLLKQIPSDHPDIPKCYQALGKISCEKGNYHEGHEYLRQALEFLEKSQLNPCHIAYIYNNIGEIYQNQGNFEEALKSYEKALHIFQEKFTDNDQNMAWCYNNLGIIYDKQNNHSKALEYLLKALDIKKTVLPPEHPCLGNTYNNLANVYYRLQQYDQALEKYQLSYAIFEKSLTSRHPSIARVSRNIGMIYEAQNKFTEAKEHYDKAFHIRESVLSLSHPDLIEIKEDILRISSKIQ